MAEFDLDNQPPEPSKKSPSGRPPGARPPNVGEIPPQKGQLPTSRASDMLRSRSSSVSTISGDPNKPPGPDFDRRATPFDDSASGLLALCGFVLLAGFGYLLWGMWSGSYADPNWSHVYAHADRERAIANIQLCGTVMWAAICVATLLFLFLFYHEDYAGYSLLLGAVLLQLGIPYATGLLYQNDHQRLTVATSQIFQLLSAQSWVIGIPGFVLTLLHVVRASIEGLEEAKVKRSSMTFGKKAVRDVKHRNQFLGPCWNLPYCKDGIRNKCPIFIKKSGPCWRTKRGCMCDQTILLMAQAPDWKQNVSATVGRLDGKIGMSAMPELPPQPQLSHHAKVERCRQCVIFNYHQEQKYKLFVGIILAATVVGLLLYNSELLTITGGLFVAANSLLGRFSTSTNATSLFPNGAPPFVEWLILSSVLLVAVAKILQLAEWVCFKLKL